MSAWTFRSPLSFWRNVFVFGTYVSRWRESALVDRQELVHGTERDLRGERRAGAAVVGRPLAVSGHNVERGLAHALVDAVEEARRCVEKEEGAAAGGGEG